MLIDGRARRPGRPIRGRTRALAFLTVWLLVGSSAASRAAAEGPLLEDALQAIAHSGVRLIYSSQTVPPGLRARAGAEGATSEARLRSLLEPLGLAARPLPAGGYVIVAAPTRRAGEARLEVSVADDAAGTPLAGAVVVLRGPGRRTRTDGAGRAAFALLAPADYELEVRARGYRTLARTVHVEPGAGTERVELRLTVDPDGVEEVIVESGRFAAGAPDGLSSRRESLAQSPITSSDAVRSLQLLPGSAVAGYSARTHVRGSRDDETQFRYDGVTLDEPYHLGSLQGLFSAIDPAVVESVTTFTGVAPIEFNGRVGAVVDIEPRRVSARMLDARASERDASLLLGTPFAGDLGSVLLGGRVLNSYSPVGWLGRSVGAPRYADLVLRTTWALGPDTQLAAGLLAIEDHRTSISDEGSQSLRFNSRDRHAWMRLTHVLAPGLRSETVVSGESSQAFMAGRVDRPGIAVGAETRTQSHLDYALREELTVEPLAGWSLRFGAERIVASSDAGLSRTAAYAAPFVPALQPVASIARAAEMQLRGASGAVYGALEWQPAARTTVDLGARRDSRHVESAAADASWNGRASVRQRIFDATTLLLGWGQVSQAPLYGAALAPDGSFRLRPERRLTQTNATLEQPLANRWLLRAAAYDKREASPGYRHENLLSPFSLVPDIDVDGVMVRAQGARMRGLELTLESDRSRALSGWASYSWSRAVDTIAGQAVPRSWDQPLALQAGAVWRRGPWHLAGVFAWHSGWPYTPISASTTRWRDPAAATLTLGARNSARLQNFNSLDLRASWERALGGGVLEASLELHDATNARVRCCREYALATDPGGGSRLVETEDYWLRFTPVLGVRWRH